MLLLLSEYSYQSAAEAGLWLRGARFTIRANPIGMTPSYKYPEHETPDEQNLLGMTLGYQRAKDST